MASQSAARLSSPTHADQFVFRACRQPSIEAYGSRRLTLWTWCVPMGILDYCKNEVLDDGSPVVVRVIRPEDKPALRAAFSRLSTESVYSRFFRAKHSLSSTELEYFTKVDFEHHVAIGVALLQDEQELPIGIGRYVVSHSDPQTAEIAFTVDDDYQGIGVGSLLLKHLYHIAKHKGIETFYATVLTTNARMLHCFSRSQLPMQQSMASGEIAITLALKGD